MSRRGTSHASLSCMPIIATFFGIVITMRFPPKERNPPHFHAEYGGSSASYLFNGTAHAGELPKKQHKLVTEWAQAHQDELEQAWIDCQNQQNPGRIGGCKTSRKASTTAGRR